LSVRYVLLGLLAQRPRHGYYLHISFEAPVENERIWFEKPAQIYHRFKTLVIAVIELTREIGMRRAIGATQAQVCCMVHRNIDSGSDRTVFFACLPICTWDIS
jgi:hypothetical protein